MIATRVLAGALLLAGMVYAGDYFFVRYRMAHPKTGEAFGTVQMEWLYAIPQKNGKSEIFTFCRQVTELWH
jgi:hypothetical protein